MDEWMEARYHGCKKCGVKQSYIFTVSVRLRLGICSVLHTAQTV